MDDILRWKDSVLWDDEVSGGKYDYPLKLDVEVADAEGLRLATGIPAEEVYRQGQFVCAKSPNSHIGPFKHAIDFLVPDGTPVYATREGVVVEMQEGSGEWGDSPDFQDRLNYMTVRHLNGEFSQYCHLARGSVSDAGVQIGSSVTRGQRIATVGKTGWTDRDHLHFIVFRMAKNESPFGFKSLVPRFA